MASILGAAYFQRRQEQSARGQVRPLANGVLAMFDLIYIVTGAVFLYVCVLYSYACDQL